VANFSGDFYSESLGMNTRLNVIFPDVSNDVTLEADGEPNVLYLLHGLSGNASEWNRFSKIEYYAKKYNFIIMMPEVQRSFYFDADYGPNYFTYVADELPQICRHWFRLPQERKKTFIAGESMGGYGAVKIALRRPEHFAAAATLSGVLNPERFFKEITHGKSNDLSPSEITALLGPEQKLKKEDDTLALIQKAAGLPNQPRLIQICGTKDSLYPDNLTFRDKAAEAGYEMTYLEWAGEHAWPFWDVAIQRALQFFLHMDLNSSPIY
jgi:putative tributyrin esterase